MLSYQVVMSATGFWLSYTVVNDKIYLLHRQEGEETRWFSARNGAGDNSCICVYFVLKKYLISKYKQLLVNLFQRNQFYVTEYVLEI